MQKNEPLKGRRTLTACVVISAIVLMAAATPALAAERLTKRAPAERATGGLTIAEHVSRQQALHRELSAIIPAGVSRTPVRVEITSKDREDLAVRAPSGTAPLRIGVVKPIEGAIGKSHGKAFNHGVVRKNRDGSLVWATTVESPGARAIRVQLTNFSLPEDTEMFFVGANGQAHGPYAGRGRNGSGEFWTRSVVGDGAQVILRYTGTTPKADLKKMSFVISQLGHISGRKPVAVEKSHDSWPCSDNATCLEDANCGNLGPAEAAKDAIAKMEWVQGPFVNTCTGGLLADTVGGSQIPYFLTANHCLTSDNSSLETFFNYATDSCNGGCPDGLTTGGTPPSASTIGFTVVATGSAADYTLGTLTGELPATAVFLGWNNAPVANEDSLFRVSNANFGPQVYSQHEVDTSATTCTSWPRGPRIYSMDINGATMGGSSGSPVLNSAGEVVGQLSGCCGFNCGDECDADSNSTVDGALAYYWDDVAQFLDPQPSACDNNGACEAGEDCNNCPNDCRAKTNGKPSGQYCCDGDLPECDDARCGQDGWTCGDGGGGTCNDNAGCDDGAFCNGIETCPSGTCVDGSDPCPGQGCDEGAGECVSCGVNKDPCGSNSDCCSNNCKNGSCKGN